MSIKTLEEIKSSVPIGEYLNGHWEVSELSFKNKGLGNLSADQTKSLSPTGLDILAVMLMLNLKYYSSDGSGEKASSE